MTDAPFAEADYNAEMDHEIHFHGDWTGGYTAHEAETADGTQCRYRTPEPETDAPPFECGPECPAPDHHGSGPRIQGQTAPTAHVEIAGDGPGQIYVSESRVQAAAPVYGPAAATEAEPPEAAAPEAGL